MITAEQAYEYSLKNNDYYNKHLDEINELIKTAAFKGHFYIKYICDIEDDNNDDIITKLIKALKELKYQVFYETCEHNNSMKYYITISWNE